MLSRSMVSNAVATPAKMMSQTLFCCPEPAEELDIPFVSSGGMADARSLVASLAMGAEGMNMGTRFIATQRGTGT